MAAITSAASIEWVVCPVIDLVVNKIATHIENKYFEKAGIEGEMKKIKTTLLEILTVMGVIDKRKTVDPHQAQLVREIKDAVYDAEDIIDEFEYDLLEKKSQEQHNKVSLVSSSSRAVLKLFVGSDKLKEKVNEVGESLNRAKLSAEMLLRLMNGISSRNMNSPVYENCYVTTSLISDEIVGREKECGLLIDLLLKQEKSPVPTIIPIVGQGGIGKTTLAQMVFNDQRLESKFDHKMWLNVSDKFDKVRLTKELLKYVQGRFYDHGETNFDILQKRLQNILASKKVLLVLDDVWYDRDDSGQYSYKREWSHFFAPLRKLDPGSKIILTTRMHIVGKFLGTVSSIILHELNEEDSWSLFKLCAFDGENQHKRPELEPIGKKIVNKLRGIALAIRVVGTQLRGNPDMEEWITTLNDNLLDTNDIMKILHRSYDLLPEHLKRCFAYCSLFPKDYHLKPNRLVHMWIAHGFVCSTDGKNLEDVGKYYLKQLLNRSFFHVIKYNNREYYVMHDLMNDLACHVSKDECHILKESDSMRNIGSIRHLSVTSEAIDILKDLCGLDKLRTLIFLGVYQWEEDINKLVNKLSRIRVLDIECITLENLINICECKHLRYLSFRRHFGLLPDCFRKLHHLRALFIRKKAFMKNLYDDPEILPKSLCSMSNLELIDASKSFFVDVFESFHVNVGELVPSHSLWRGPASLHIKENSGHGLELLGSMDKIKGRLLIAGLQNVADKEEATKAQLGNKKHVRYLILEWWNSTLEMEKNSSKYHEVLEALSPNPNLETLNFYKYPGAAWPSWLESKFLSTIRSISLNGCERVKMLPALGQLPLLKYLSIRELVALKRIGLEFYGNGTFRSLQTFRLVWLTSLEKWSYPSDEPVFPKLRTLEILNCPLFTGLQQGSFPSLQYLRIARDQSVPSLEYLRIACEDGLNMLTNAQFQEHIFLPALTKLEITQSKALITLEGLKELVSLQRFYIDNCPNLLSLPEMELLYSLQFLAIFNCPKLNALPKKGLPVSLRLLCVGGIMHPSLEYQIRNKKGPDWDKVAAISGCHLCAAFVNQCHTQLKSSARFISQSDFSLQDYYDYAECIRKYGVNKDVGAQ